MNKIALGINVCADDWTAKRVIILIISSNGELPRKITTTNAFLAKYP